jgi:hypothetical protein
VLIAAILALGGAAAMTRPQWMAWNLGTATPVGLYAQEEGRQLVILWNHQASTIQRADRGVLVLVDGGESREVPLTAEELRTGSVTTVRQAEDVEVRLALFEGVALLGEEVTRFVGLPPGAGVTDLGAGGASPTDLDGLQRMVEAEKQRNQQLRESVRALEERLAPAR